MTQAVILIMGMHRSGTSALARVINLMGVDLGRDLMPARPDNPSGMWEHRGIAEIHEEILGRLGLRWHSVSEMPEQWQCRKEVRSLKERIILTIKRELARSQVWGLKDPRMCRMLPLWHSILEELKVETYVVHIVRSPLELAMSLRKRNGFGLDKSMLLWLRYVIESECETRRYPRVFVTFEQLLGDWRVVAGRIEDRSGFRFPRSVESIGDDVDRFLRPDLRHHHAKMEIGANADIRELWVGKAYNAFLEAAENRDTDLPETMTQLDREIRRTLGAFPSSALLEDLQSEIAAWSDRRNSIPWRTASHFLKTVQQFKTILKS
jgi:hypothetical protein